MEGFEFFQVSEKQDIFKKCEDFCAKGNFPVEHNAPHLNVRLGGDKKIRAVLDTGSTNTIMSHACAKLLNLSMKPTSFGFSGVSQGKEQYKGIVQDLEVQLSDSLATKINVAVVPSDVVFFLLGNDFIGGAYAKFSRVYMNDLLGNMLL